MFAAPIIQGIQETPSTVSVPMYAERWRFEGDGKGVLRAHDLTLMNSPTFVAGKVGQALQFDPDLSQYAKTSGPVLDTTESFTVCCWIKVANSAEYRTFLSQSGSTVGAFYLQLYGSPSKARLSVYSSDSTSGLEADLRGEATVLGVGDWVHLAGVYDKAAAKALLYLNATLEVSANMASPPVATSGAFYVGASYYDGGMYNFVSDLMDEPYAIQAALAADQILAVANHGEGR